MRFILSLILSFFVLSAQAAIQVSINKSTQTMAVTIDGVPTYHWSVSTGKAGFITPNGVYRAQRLHRHYHSRKYNAPMPYSIFFRGGYAIHAGHVTGAPASHGCVRLSHANAARLFHLVQDHGRHQVAIRITGASTSDLQMMKKKKRFKKASRAKYRG